METLVQKPEADLLSQQDIERLLELAAAPSSPGDEPRQSNATKPGFGLPAHSFRSSSTLPDGPLRQLSLEHEDWARSLGLCLSNYLRLDLDIELASLQMETCRDFLEGLEQPSHLAMFKLSPWRGLCVFQTAPSLALSLVDRLMGGTSHPIDEPREMSEIETALLDQVLDVLLGNWCEHWAKIQELQPQILGHENNPRYVQVASPDASMLVVVLQVRVGESVREMRLAFPSATIEPLLRALPGARREMEKEVVEPKAPAKWNPVFSGVKVGLVAEWPEKKLSARQITGLRVGDVLEWDPSASAKVKVRLSQNPKFVGRLGTRQGCWAVEITGKCNKPSV